MKRRRMLVLCPYPEGVAAGQRLKYEQHFDEWRRSGWDIEISNYMDRAMWEVMWRPGHRIAKVVGVIRGHARRLRDIFRIGRYDLIYVFMWVTPLGTTLFERIVRIQAKKLVYDVEDNILTKQQEGPTTHTGPVVRLLKGPRKARFLIRVSDAVIVASPNLAEPYLAMSESNQVYCISPSLDMERVCPASPEMSQNIVPVIGWTGTFSSRTYLDMLASSLQRLAERVEFRLRVIGNFEYELPNVQLDVVQWTAEREAADLQSLDIGIYPLVDDEWTRGKAGLKIIQYQAAGLPCVASDVPLSRDQIRHGETGFLAATEEEWLEYLERLVRDPKMRRDMGNAARRDAINRYSSDKLAKSYIAVFDNLSGLNCKNV